MLENSDILSKKSQIAIDKKSNLCYNDIMKNNNNNTKENTMTKTAMIIFAVVASAYVGHCWITEADEQQPETVQQDTETTTTSKGSKGSRWDYIKSRKRQQSKNRINQYHSVKEFAQRMGISVNGSLNWKSQAGVPVEINGQKVPTKLYTPEQLERISLAKSVSKAMGN